MASSFKVEIEKFDGSNDFGLWRVKMLAHLGIMGLGKALEGESNLPATLDSAKKEELLERARNTLILSLGDKVLREVFKCTTAAEMWLKLESLYMTKTLSSRLYLKMRFFTFKMFEGKELLDHIDEFNKLIVDLGNIGVEYEDEDLALVLLYSLPKSYENLVDILQHGRESISLEEVVGALKSKEHKKKIEREGTSGDGLFMAHGRIEKRDAKEKKKGYSKSHDGKKIFKCYACHEEGHLRKNCPNRRGGNANRRDGEAAIAQNVVDGYESADVLVVSTDHSDKRWILDSGCSFHMTPNESWFESYKKTSMGEVLLGNNKSCKVVGIGTVRIKTHDGVERILTDVRHVPELKRNLISLSTLDQKGFCWKGEKNVLKVTKRLLVVMKGVRERGLYVLQGSTLVGDAAAIMEPQKTSLASLWYKRLGHVSDRGLKGWKLWHKDGETSKCAISRDAIFRETEYYMTMATQTVKDSNEVARERAEIEVELLGKSTTGCEKDGGTNSGGHLEEIEEEGGEVPEGSLDSYQLARGRHRRETRVPARYGYSDLVAFALVAAEEVDVLAEGSEVVEKIHTDDNPADMATKVVTGIKFQHCCNLINVTKLGN